jgi:hypothetical protein
VGLALLPPQPASAAASAIAAIVRFTVAAG